MKTKKPAAKKAETKAPRINLCFQGWIRGAEVKKATNTATGKEVNVSKMESWELAKKLQTGELTICLGDYLYETDKQEVELFDFEENDF